jgi:hypothetical protein
MSQDRWSSVVLGNYLDMKDLEKDFPDAPTDHPELLEEHVQQKINMDVCVHMVDGQIVGVGIGLLISENMTSEELKKGINKIEGLAPFTFKKPPKTFTLEMSD